MSMLPNLSLAMTPEAGGYFSLLKILLVLPPVFGWLWVSAWLDKDAQRVHSPRLIWTSMILAGGVAALTLWLLLSIYIAGIGIFIVTVASISMAYVSHRNGKVVPDARVLTSDHIMSLIRKEKKNTADIVMRLRTYDKSGTPVPPPVNGTVEERVIYNRVQDLLYDIVWRRASEVDIATGASGSAIRYVIDGVVVNRPAMERNEAEEAIDYLKGIAGMEVADKRRPQTGKIVVDLANQPIDISMIAAGSTSGQRMQLKIVQEAVRTRIEDLGMSEDVLKRIRQISASTPGGLVLVSAKPSNGLTSTLYSLLRDNDAYIKQLVTVEAKPDVDMENVTQHPYKSPEDMPRVLAGVMRRDPDVIMVDQCQDAEGAQAILNATEKRVLLGIQAPDSFTALAKWIKTVGKLGPAVEPLQAVMCQVLVRKLCPACREPYKPDQELLRKANLSANKVDKFFRPPTKPLTDEKGNPITCSTCQGSAYLGRTAAFELLEINDETRQLIAGGANLTTIRQAARKGKMLNLQEQALQLVAEGTTSIQEVIRVTRTKEQGQ